MKHKTLSEMSLSKIPTNKLKKLLSQARKETKQADDFTYYDWILSATKELRRRFV